MARLRRELWKRQQTQLGFCAMYLGEKRQHTTVSLSLRKSQESFVGRRQIEQTVKEAATQTDLLNIEAEETLEALKEREKQLAMTEDQVQELQARTEALESEIEAKKEQERANCKTEDDGRNNIHGGRDTDRTPPTASTPTADTTSGKDICGSGRSVDNCKNFRHTGERGYGRERIC